VVEAGSADRVAPSPKAQEPAMNNPGASAPHLPTGAPVDEEALQAEALARFCAACNAEPGEPCSPDCLGAAAAQDAAEAAIDQVSCAGCGNLLDDDLPLTVDAEGFARHEQCQP
jgi:hypothetical protein